MLKSIITNMEMENMMYKERFEAIELEPCELVMIRELAVNYRKNLLEKYHVGTCCYGHLHGPVIRRRVEGQRGETAFSLISGDYLGFVPKKICD